jgi:hypothetical protein
MRQSVFMGLLERTMARILSRFSFTPTAGASSLNVLTQTGSVVSTVTTVTNATNVLNLATTSFATVTANGYGIITTQQEYQQGYRRNLVIS